MATQTRISEATHERLSRLAVQTGLSHREILDAAVRSYERELFLNAVNAGYARLGQNPDAMKAHDEELAKWDATSSDGVD